MSESRDLICKDFENEKWLFMEKSLPAERMKFWHEHMKECTKCESAVQTEKAMLKVLGEELSDDILDAKFDSMIDVSVIPKKKTSISRIFDWRREFAMSTKVALISGLAVVAIVISLITPRQNPVKAVSSELLDWEGEKINSQIENIEKTIENISSDKWQNDIQTIDDRLQKLEIDIEKF